MSGDTVAEVAIALTNVGPTPLKAKAAEDALRGKALTDAAMADAADLAMSICDPVADQRGDAEYKTAMAGEMTQRALRTARSRAAAESIGIEETHMAKKQAVSFKLNGKAVDVVVEPRELLIHTLREKLRTRDRTSAARPRTAARARSISTACR